MNKGMKNHVMRAAACFLAGTMTVAGSSAAVGAAGVSLVGINVASQVDNTEAAVETETETVAGTEALVGTEVVASTQEDVTEEVTYEVTEEESEVYVAPVVEENLVDTTVVAQIGDAYINIRSNPSTDADIIGKMYNNNAATVLADDGEWLYIQSGNCTGYVAKYLMTTGEAAEEVVDEIGTPVAQSHVEALMVRSDASTEGEVVDMITSDDLVYLEEDLGGWAKVTTSNGVTGYVCADYVSYDTEMPLAESREEEAARIEAENQAWLEYLAEQERLYLEALAAEQAAWEAQNQAWIEYLASQGQYVDPTTGEITYTEPTTDNTYTDTTYEDTYTDTTYEDTTTDTTYEDTYTDTTYEDTYTDTTYEDTYTDTTVDTGVSSARQQIVDYALQFVGNPYVWGGTSLTNGADCSGFVQSVLGDNGISVNRTAGAQSQGGTSVDLSNIQPGDLLFYEGSGDYGIGHVSMYIGDGQVVHASNSTDGIIISDVNYRTPVSAKSYID